MSTSLLSEELAELGKQAEELRKRIEEHRRAESLPVSPSGTTNEAQRAQSPPSKSTANRVQLSALNDALQKIDIILRDLGMQGKHREEVTTLIRTRLS